MITLIHVAARAWRATPAGAAGASPTASWLGGPVQRPVLLARPLWGVLWGVLRGLLRGLLLGLLFWHGAAEAAGDSYLGRPIYSEPATGLQLPPGCAVDPSWRAALTNSELEIWIAQCNGEPHAWLLKRQVLEVVSARVSRLRFQVLDDRAYPGETAGDTLSVQCSGANDEPGYLVRGAQWRGDGRELRLKGARGVLRVDARNQRLVDAEIGAVVCVRFPEREAMMRRLQQTHN